MTERMYGVQKEHLKKLTKKEFIALREMCHLSKNMYNVGLYNVRQHFFETKEYLPYKENYHRSKSNENYKLMGSAGAQQTLKKVEENFKSFFGLLRNKGQKPRIPSYLDKSSFFELTYPQFKMQKDGTFNVPMSPAFKKKFGKVNITFPKNLCPEDIVEIRIIPKYNATYFEIEYVYEIIESIVYNLVQAHALSIDIGINNFASCIDTLGTSFLIDGKRIKSVNQWYNKENKRLQSIKNKQNIQHLTKKQTKLLIKRNNILRDFLNKTTRYVINHCLDNGIGKIVFGHNKEWKKDVKLRKKDKQTFVQIPHSQWMKKLESMCKRYGIEFIKQEESYTSKASFLDNDELPVYEPGTKLEKKFSGRRIQRGLFRTAQNLLINADLNGAANILRKSNHNFHMEKVTRGLLASPMRIRLV